MNGNQHRSSTSPCGTWQQGFVNRVLGGRVQASGRRRHRPPLGYGMPSCAYGTYLRGGQPYEVSPDQHHERLERVITFSKAGEGSEQNAILQNGWLLGEAVIRRRRWGRGGTGKGRVVVGFPQPRVQMWARSARVQCCSDLRHPTIRPLALHRVMGALIISTGYAELWVIRG